MTVNHNSMVTFSSIDRIEPNGPSSGPLEVSAQDHRLYSPHLDGRMLELGRQPEPISGGAR